ncbi:MAG: hypothetical protein ACOYZ7_20940 [Chloroflexota bacterium]
MAGFLMLVLTAGGLWYGAVEMGYLARPWGKYDCPVKGRRCRSAEAVSLGGEYFGLGFLAPSGEEYRALVDSVSVRAGTMSVGQTKEEAEEFFSEAFEGGGAVYLLKGEVKQRAENVEKGQVLGRVTGERLGYFGNYNLVVYWTDGEGKKVKVLPQDLR